MNERESERNRKCVRKPNDEGEFPPLSSQLHVYNAYVRPMDTRI